MTALNPVINLGEQIADAIMAHDPMNKRQALERAAELFKLVGIDGQRLRASRMSSRAACASARSSPWPWPSTRNWSSWTSRPPRWMWWCSAISCSRSPPCRAQFGFSILFITHDLSLLVEFSNRIAIMYAGKIAELAPAAALFDNPKHPYTAGLMNSFPSITGEKRKLHGIPGSRPTLWRRLPAARSRRAARM